MPKRIEKLTAEQEAMLPGIADEWIRAGLSTEPADRPAAEEGVRMAYPPTPSTANPKPSRKPQPCAATDGPR